MRDQIHCHDVARLFLEFYRSPKCVEVYNLGGGRNNSLSILETINLLVNMGYKLRYTYEQANRVGDHICYISDLTKIRAHFPQWELEYNILKTIAEIASRYESRCTNSDLMMNYTAR